MLNINKITFSGDASFANPPSLELTDRQALMHIRNWMLDELPCIAGRRETVKNRYMIEIATRDTVPELFQTYSKALRKGNIIACLLIFNTPEYMSFSKSVGEVFYFLAEQMQRISRVSTKALATGSCLTKEIKLHCPITGVLTHYDDFECIAFCPQSNNPDDPLYDPLMALPFPAVNISSDMFAFSNFVADMVKQRYQKTVRELSADQVATKEILHSCVKQWQRMAVKTIQNYEAITDTSLCPIHLNNNQDQWIAGHKDPAFAEQIKEAHTHELPVLYATRIVEEWLSYFYEGKAFSALGLARDGEMT